MKYTVGKYVIVPEKPFPSMEKAVQYIQGDYPELDKQTIEKYLNPKVESNGNNKSNNSVEKDSNGQAESAKDSATSVKGVSSGKDKSEQPSKG